MPTLDELRANPALKLLLRRILRLIQELNMHEGLGDPHGTAKELRPHYVQLIAEAECEARVMGFSEAQAEEQISTLMLEAIVANKGRWWLDSMTLEQALGEEPL